MNIATGELAAHALGTAQEWKDLAETLQEQLQDARTERNALSAWADRAPDAAYPGRVAEWLKSRPQFPAKGE